MIRVFNKIFALAMCAIVIFAVSAPDLSYAKGGGGGRSGGFSSSRSSGGGWGSSKPSSGSSSSGWGSSSKSKSTPSTPSKSATAAPAPKPAPAAKPTTVKDPLTGRTRSSATDQAAYNKAKSSGKAFTSAKAAKTDFVSKSKSDPQTQAALSKSYPTTFSSQPSTRPDYIPSRYNGREVIYRNGGYGYVGSDGGYNALMTYMLVDTMTDAMLMSAMSNQGYYVGNPAPMATVAPIHTASHMFVNVLLACVAIFVVVVVLLVLSGVKIE